MPITEYGESLCRKYVDDFLPLMRTSHRGQGFLSMGHKGQDAPSTRLSARIKDFLTRSEQSDHHRGFKHKNLPWKGFSTRSVSTCVSLSGSTDLFTSLGGNENGSNSFAEDDEDTGEDLSMDSALDSSAASLLDVQSQKSTKLKSQSNAVSFTSDHGIISRKTQQETDLMKIRTKGEESYYSDKIFLVRKQCTKACESAETSQLVRQLFSKMEQEIRNLSNDVGQFKSKLEHEKDRNGKLEDRIRREYEENANGAALIKLKSIAIQELNQEKAEVAQHAEYLRTELHRVKLELHLKETRLSALEREMAENNLLHSDEIAGTISSFQGKLVKLEAENSFLQEDLEAENLSKKRLEEEIKEIRRNHQVDSEQYNAELKALHEAHQIKLTGLELRFSHSEKERAELLKFKRDLETKIIEMEIAEESLGLTGQATWETIKQQKAEINRLRIFLKDFQLTTETNHKTDVENKAIIRQMKTTLEVVDSEKSQLNRLRAKAEEELQDAMNHLSDVTRSENETQTLNTKLAQENARLQTDVEELNLALENALKHCRLTLEEAAAEKSNLADQLNFNKALTQDNGILKEKVAQLTKKMEILEETQQERENLLKKMLHLRQGEFRSKIKMEEIKQRRAEDQLEKLKSDLNLAQQDLLRLRVDRKSAMQLLKLKEKESREAIQGRKALAYQVDELTAKNAKLTKLFQISTTESESLREELRSSIRRINEAKEAIRACAEDEASILV